MINLNKKFQKLFFNHVLLVHSTLNKAPLNKAKLLHNINNNDLKEILLWLKKDFKFIFVDELLNSKNKNGLCALTFDDAYKSVFEHTLPMLKDIGIPCTIYIVGNTINKKIFWRDKIRFIIKNNLIDEFISYIPISLKKNINNENFYSITKNKKLNSKLIDFQIDKFLLDKNIDISEHNYCIDDLNYLEKSDLVSYGNHTYNHYVLSSLTYEEQFQEINSNHELLKKLNIQKSNVFSLPFGRKEDLNEDTYKILNNLKYKGILMSRNRLNYKNIIINNNLREIERYMVEDNLIKFKRQVFKLGIKSAINYDY